MNPAPLFDLHGMVALVTGSTRGIGHAAAMALARQGAHVVFHGRSEATAQSAAEAARQEGFTADACAFDAADVAAAQRTVDALEARLGKLDIVFVNAAIQHRAPLLEFDLADFERIIFTNLTAQWALARHAAAHMVRRGFGRVIFTGSITAILGRERVTAYTAAKAALHATVRQWSTELSPSGVTVNAIAPGYVRTEFTSGLREDGCFEQWLKQRTPAGRWGEPQDIAAAAAFLASREAGFITGQILVVDGGLTATM